MELKKVELKPTLRKKINDICHGIYHLNVPYAIGYLFNKTKNGKDISNGMFCNFEREIDEKEWSYFYEFNKEGILYLIK